MGWNWIGLVVSSIDYCLQGAIDFQRKAATNGICISFFETISFGLTDPRMAGLVASINRSTSRVIVLYCSPADVTMIFLEVLQQNLTGKVWVGIESWYTTPLTQYNKFWKLLNGSIGIAKSRKVLPNFSSFLQTIHPSAYPRMLSIWQFWETLFKCKRTADVWNSSILKPYDDNQTCTGLERIVTDDVTEFDDPRSQAVYMAHNALYAIVHALHNLLFCKPDGSLFTSKLCADIKDIQPWQVYIDVCNR